MNNATVPVYQSVTVTATEGANNTTVTGNNFIPKTAENFGYDADGNEISDGRWNYTWDGENRLTRLVANTAVGPQQRIDFAYDWRGRRISKKVWNNTAGTGTPMLDERYLYDGWNLLVQLNATNNVVIRSYVWGSDLSGSLQGAGGVGGLLEVNDGVNGAHFCAYDGNGNVTALVKASDGTISANYEYDPFGNVIRATGLMAFANPFRFSTKFQDDESGLLYYGYRYLNSSTGRWLSRDPIEENGGANLCGFVRNDPGFWLDALGLEPEGILVGNQ